MGAVGAAGLTRVGMKAARAMESELLDRHDYVHDGSMRFLQAWTDATKPPEGKWLDENPGCRVRPMAGHVLAVRRRPYEGSLIDIPDTAANRYDDQRELAQFVVHSVALDVTSIAPGDTILAAPFAGKRAQLLKRDMVLLRAPEVTCCATEFDLSTDIMMAKDADPAAVIERLPDDKVRVRRASNPHGTARARADGCVCNGEIAAVIYD